MKTIGKALREARERQGLSIEDVAETTKIHPYKLTAIEEDDRKLLPARVFAIGLIKSYARELKVDMTLIDELCQKAYDETDLSTPTPETPPPPTSPPSQEPPAETQPVGLFQIPKPFAILLSLGFIMALVLSIYFVAQKMESYSQEEAQANSILNFEEEDSENVFPNDSEKPSAEATTEETQSVDAAPEETLPEKETTDESLTTTSEAAEVEVEENNNFEEDSDTTNPPTAEGVNSAAAVSFSDQKLTIKALDKVRIEVIWSDGYNQGLILKRSESKTLIFSSPIKVRINNGGAVEINYKDKNQGVPGSLNKPIELKYP